jgi:ribose transport system ATP-binding protein
MRPRRPADAMAAGIAFVPENRAEDAAMVDMSVNANISAATVANYWSWKRPWIASRRMRKDAEGSMEEFLVKAASEEALLSTLSGGNQQKVVLARWLRRDPRLLLLDEPTQGVDVGARAEIYALVRDAVAAGASALIVASDFEELAHVCDRVLVLSRGRITGEVRPPQLDADYLMQAANQATNGRSDHGH